MYSVMFVPVLSCDSQHLQHVDKPLRVYVYSHDFEYAYLHPVALSLLTVSSSALREVVLVPNRQWGGEGLLGCVFGLVVISPKRPN